MPISASFIPAGLGGCEFDQISGPLWRLVRAVMCNAFVKVSLRDKSEG